MILNKIKGYRALVYVNDFVLLAKKNEIFKASLSLDRIQYICTLRSTSLVEKIIFSTRLLQRLFRLEVGPAVYIKERELILVFLGKNLYSICLASVLVREELIPSLTKRPLQMHVSNKEDGVVYFGEYTSNFQYGPVKIYRRDLEKGWDVAFVFEEGQINHVHGIHEVPDDNNYYILTGDFQSGAGIWITDTNFSEVKPLIRGSQDARACWIKTWSGRTFIATDRQDSCNYLCEFLGGKIKKLFPIVGSSIYCASSFIGQDLLVFSTAVEPNSSNKLSIISLCGFKRADGILSDHACVYAGNPIEGFKILFSRKKDWLPFGLFQFGNISFPSGKNNGQILHFYCIGLSGADDSTYAVDAKHMLCNDD